MTGKTYEIHLRGEVPAVLTDALTDVTRVTAPDETVLVTAAIDQEGLDELIRRIRDLGLELRELRRMPGPREGEA